MRKLVTATILAVAVSTTFAQSVAVSFEGWHYPDGTVNRRGQNLSSYLHTNSGIKATAKTEAVYHAITANVSNINTSFSQGLARWVVDAPSGSLVKFKVTRTTFQQGTLIGSLIPGGAATITAKGIGGYCNWNPWDITATLLQGDTSALYEYERRKLSCHLHTQR
jgi:hypothetical protein